MESIQSIKRRIKAIANTSQITAAMEMVSANKMRKSQIIALNTRPYAIASLELLRELVRRTSFTPNLMAKPEKENQTLLILITSDKGLAGSFNSNVFRIFEKNIALFKDNFICVAVGKKAHEFINRKNIPLVRSFVKFGDFAKPEETITFSDFIIEGYLQNKWSKVITISAQFRTTLRQDVLIRELLPISFEKIDEAIRSIIPEYGRFAGEAIGKQNQNFKYEYLIEPATNEGIKNLLENLTKHLVEMVVYNIILESNASEHSARMVAMKNASENARELKDELSLMYNKSRQASITQELTEIIGGMSA